MRDTSRKLLLRTPVRGATLILINSDLFFQSSGSASTTDIDDVVLLHAMKFYGKSWIDYTADAPYAYDTI